MLRVICVKSWHTKTPVFASTLIAPLRTLKHTQTQSISTKLWRAYSGSSEQSGNVKNLRFYKRAFAVCLFTGTFAFAWYLKKRKGARLKDLLEEFTRIQVDESLFDKGMSFYRHKGYVFPGPVVMSGVFKELPHFEFKSDDVIVASYPKTGTTWLQEIVYMLTHKCKKSTDSSEILETRFPYLEYPYPGIKSIKASKAPRFIKTHLPFTLLPPSFKDSNAKLLYITRNPRDTAISYFYFMQLLTPFSFQGNLSDFLKLFLSDTAMYSPFFDHVLGYWEARRDPNILFVTYEDLHEKPISTIKKVAEFLGVDVSEADIEYVAKCTSFSSMSTNASVNYEHWKDLGFAHKEKGRFLRKGKVGDWQRHLTSAEVAAFEEWESRSINGHDLRFVFTLPSPVNESL